MSRLPKDDYYVLMWNFYDPLYSSGPERAAEAIERFRDLGCNGGTCIATFIDPDSYDASLEAFGLPKPDFDRRPWNTSPFLENGFAFYLMNLCRPLYWEWDKAKPIFRDQYESFARDGEPSVFIRTPCLNDPRVLKAMDRRTLDVMDGLANARDLSLLYDIRDELSATAFVLSSDCCFCDHCMTRMRSWLQDRHTDLGALNAAWDTSFESWGAVRPLTTLEALDRRDAGNGNFAPWAEHRVFVDDTLARVCAEQRALVQGQDAEALVGPTGTQCPSVFGGYDFSKLVPTCDWLEAYDFGGSVDCIRSFKTRRDVRILKTTGLGGGADAARAMLWTYVFQSGGYSGTIIWQSNAMVDVESTPLAPTAEGSALAPVFTGLRGGVPRLLQRTEEVSSPVAVHYSQASIQADLITWLPNRARAIGGLDPERTWAYQCRAAWWKLLEDRGLRPLYVSSDQVKKGELIDKGFKLLVLPRSIAISDKEAEEIRRFVEAGGTVLADSFTGRMDELCRERDVGALDDLFGVDRKEGTGYSSSDQRASFDPEGDGRERPVWGGGPLRAECCLIEEEIEPASDGVVLGCSEYTDSPIGLTRCLGKGRAILMNAAPLAYVQDRRRPKGGAALQAFFGWAIDRSGVTADARVVSAESGKALPGWRVWTFKHGNATYVGVAPDLDVSQDVLGAIEVADGGVGAQTVKVELPTEGHIYEAVSARAIGEGSAVTDELGPQSVRLYAILPYSVDTIGIERTGDAIEARLVTSAEPGEHVFRFELLDGDGVVIVDSGANVVAKAGAASWVPDAITGAARVRCRDVATGVTGEMGL